MKKEEIIIGFLAVGLAGSLWANWHWSKQYGEIITEKAKLEIDFSGMKLDKEYWEGEAAHFQKMIENEVEKESKLDACLSTAGELYQINWSNSCKTKAEAAKIAYAKCIANEYVWCDNNYSAEERTFNAECSLPSDTAKRWDNSLKESKDECFKRYK